MRDEEAALASCLPSPFAATETAFHSWDPSAALEDILIATAARPAKPAGTHRSPDFQHNQDTVMDGGLSLDMIEQAASSGGNGDDHPEIVLSSLLQTHVTSNHALEISKALFLYFGSLGAIFASSERSLGRFLNGFPDAITLLRCVHRAMVISLREPLNSKPILGDSAVLKAYLQVSLAHEERETVRLLFLNSKNLLIIDELHSSGTINHTPVYPREIVRRIIEVNATALIIVHNHPSGDPTPSLADVEMTRRLALVLSEIGVRLHDSVVVGTQGMKSLRSCGLL